MESKSPDLKFLNKVNKLFCKDVSLLKILACYFMVKSHKEKQGSYYNKNGHCTSKRNVLLL